MAWVRWGGSSWRTPPGPLPVFEEASEAKGHQLEHRLNHEGGAEEVIAVLQGYLERLEGEKKNTRVDWERRKASQRTSERAEERQSKCNTYRMSARACCSAWISGHISLMNLSWAPAARGDQAGVGADPWPLMRPATQVHSVVKLVTTNDCQCVH